MTGSRLGVWLALGGWAVGLVAGQKSVYVHYNIPAGGAKSAFNKLQPVESSESTGFAAIEHQFGYLALQQNEKGFWKQAQPIFAMWDPDCRTIMGPPGDCPAASRGVIVEAGPDAQCQRYGYAGTGTKCEIRFNQMSTAQTYSFMLEATITAPGRVRYDAYFHAPELNGWNLVGKIEIAHGSESWYMSRLSSFTEAWDGRSPNDRRWGNFGPMYMLGSEAQAPWRQLTTGQASFNAAEHDLNVQISPDNNLMQLQLAPEGGLTVTNGQEVRVAAQGEPAELTQFNSMKASAGLPGGCLGGTCAATERRMFFENLTTKSYLPRTILGLLVILAIIGGIVYGVFMVIRSRQQARGYGGLPGQPLQPGMQTMQMQQMQQQQPFMPQPRRF